MIEKNQLQLLKDLANQIKSEIRDRDVVVHSLQSAKILTKKENFTGHLKNLEKVFSAVD